MSEECETPGPSAVDPTPQRNDQVDATEPASSRPDVKESNGQPLDAG